MTRAIDEVDFILKATSYVDVFGSDSGSDIPGQVKCRFRSLARLVHPDMFTDESAKRRAGDAFARLNTFHQEAKSMIEQGSYGKPTVLIDVSTKKFHHKLLQERHRDDLSTHYIGTSTNGTSELVSSFAVYHSLADNDLAVTAARMIKDLRRGCDAQFETFLPECLDSFALQLPDRTRHQVNAFRALPDGFVSLAEVRRAHPNGVDQRDMIWVFRRVLHILGYVHSKGIVHGAVLPGSIWIHPKMHGLVLDQWNFAVQKDGGFPAIKGIIASNRAWYPEEVLAKQSPSEATDIYMVAKTMVDLLGGDGVHGTVGMTVRREFRAFLRGCMSKRQDGRPSDAHQLLAEFDELLEQMGSPFYPRRFHTFTMPLSAS